MAFADNDVIRVSCRMLLDGVDDVVNVYHIKVFDNGTGTLDDQLAEVRTWFGEAYAFLDGLFPNNLLPNVLDIYNVTQDVPYGQHTWIGGFTGGTATGSLMPPQDAQLVLWTTAVKRLQGKTYLGPYTVSSMGDGLWNSGTVTAVANYASHLMDNRAGENAEAFLFGVYSKTTGTFAVPTGRRISQQPATQRRRKRGRGS